MFLIFHNKFEFLALLPKGGKWAEIGVCRGDFSEHILNICGPEELHLIDPWHFDLDFDWFCPPDYSERFGDAKKFVMQLAAWTGVPPEAHVNEHFENLYQRVKTRFADRSEVSIHRQTAHAAAALFADHYFDFVYIDGAHDYENVLLDLKTYDAKVKPSGALIGDDYCEHGSFANAVYGVIGAVTHFRKVYGPRELVLNPDFYTTFGLFPPNSQSWRIFLDNLLRAGRPIIELPDALAANYWHRPVIRSDGRGHLIQSFT